jgi:GT2 family glycosyltransferase
MKLNIIMATYGNLEKSKIAYESIMRNTDVYFKLIVIDQNSPDGTKEFLQSLPKRDNVHVEFFPQNKGLVYARNFGIDNLDKDAEFVVFFDNDIVATPCWASRMVEFFRQHPEVGVAGPASNFAGTPQLIEGVPNFNFNEIEKIEDFSEEVYNKYPEFKHVPYRWTVVGFSMFLRRTVVDQVGHFDVNISGEWDDSDYCHRIEDLDWGMVYVDYIYIHHWGHASHDIVGHQYTGENHDKTVQYMIEKWGSI